MSLADCRLVQLPIVADERGCLSVVEAKDHLPFAIQRVYYLYDVPDQHVRGQHGHRRLQQFMIAMAGAFAVTLDDGRQQHRFHLHRPDEGLYIAPMMWRTLDNFTRDAVCVVLASAAYDETDYLRDYAQFLAAAAAP